MTGDGRNQPYPQPHMTCQAAAATHLPVVSLITGCHVWLLLNGHEVRGEDPELPLFFDFDADNTRD
jgi:hypothetical protein